MVLEEKEIKLNLESEENYDILIRHFKNHKKEIQLINFFFDTDKCNLSRNGWALRIRKFPDKYVMTAKGMAAKGIKGLTIRPEIETELPYETAENMIENGFSVKDIPEQILEAFKDTVEKDAFKQILYFSTLRTVIAYETDSLPIQLEVDKTTFPDNTIDFELEIELPQKDLHKKIIEQIKALLDRLKIPLIFQKNSKFARALKKMGSDMIVDK